MAYGPGWAAWKVCLTDTGRKRKRVARRWRATRRVLSYACASYRRPYTRPALDEDQRRAQLAISRRPCAAPPQKSALDVFVAATRVAGRLVATAVEQREQQTVSPSQ